VTADAMDFYVPKISFIRTTRFNGPNEALLCVLGVGKREHVSEEKSLKYGSVYFVIFHVEGPRAKPRVLSRENSVI
jgi:hypothetical protein